MKYILFVFGFLISFSIYGQKVLRYEGSYPNDKHETATANYSYYKDSKTGKNIKQGSFRYVVKIKSPDKRLYRNVTGEYQKGWKNGIWTYSYSTKDYNIKNDGYFYTISVNLEAYYENGWPHGEWNYTSFIKRRKGVRSQGKTKWAPYEIVENQRIRLNYEKGLLIDSLWIRNSFGKSIFVQMDSKGFLINDFKIEGGGQDMQNSYKQGFQISAKDQTTKTALMADFNYYNKHSHNLKSAGAILDTVSLFSRKDCIISKVLNGQVYNNSYFNFRHIDGDRQIRFSGSRNNMNVGYKGLYIRKLGINISSNEQAIIQDIYGFRAKIIQQYNQCNKAYRNSNSDPVLRKKVSSLKNSKVKMDAYFCQLQTYKTVLVPSQIVLKSSSCNSDAKIEGPQTRLQIINTIYSRAKIVYSNASKKKCP